MVAPPKTDCSATIFPPSPGREPDRVAEHAGVRLDREPPGDLLVLPGGGQQHRRRGLPGHQRGEQLGLRGGHIIGDVAAAGDVDRGGAVLGQPRLPLLGAVPGPDHRGLTELAGERQQLEGDLLDLAAGVLGENQNLSHDQPPSQMNFCAARNSAALAPPSPSSLTIVPACRGGRSAKSTTSVAAFARPTRAVSMPGVGAAHHLQRLLLRGHDPLERRVPRLVDLLHHADHRRQARLNPPVAVVGLPVDP